MPWEHHYTLLMIYKAKKTLEHSFFIIIIKQEEQDSINCERGQLLKCTQKTQRINAT